MEEKEKKNEITVLSERVITDCYEFLHLVEVGRGSLEDLIDVSGNDKNLYESNYRQVERIKHRCMLLGIHIEFNYELEKFVTERNAKLKLLDKVRKIKRPHSSKKPPKPTTFGSYSFRKVIHGK